MLECDADALDGSVLDAWQRRVMRAREQLGWPAGAVAVRPHRRGVSLALAAPFDQLFTATEVNEWALCGSLHEREPQRWHALEETLAAAQPDAPERAVLDDQAALERLARLARAEARPGLRALVAAAESHAVPVLIDEETVTLGIGARSHGWPIDCVPLPAAVPWAALGTIPVALVTGSNGKTTTVRLLAACATAYGWPTGFSCTDGLYVDGHEVASGDYSGPVGARTILRDKRVAAAVLETARGGILRRGLAMARANVAIVTNVSADHFGEYGIDDLDALAAAKLVVGRALGSEGLLVLNADDATLRAASVRLEQPLGWIALDADHAVLADHRAHGGAVCGARGGRLWMHHKGVEHDLGTIADMPLMVDGSATYNIANAAGTALAAAALGIPPPTIRAVLARFGARPEDNLGRLARLDLGGVRVLMDYAHNPAGLRGVLHVARHLQQRGRLALLLGQAGNRADADIEQLAAVAADARPDLIVVKEIDGYQRGRPEGEIARILRAALLRHGLRDAALPVRLRELDAARHALEWARPGDVVVLLVHSLRARMAVSQLLARLRQDGWMAGEPLPS